MKKRNILYGTLLLLLCTIVVHRWFYPGRGVTRMNFNRIQPGSTFAEIHELLSSARDGPPWCYGEPIRVPNQGCVEYWLGDFGTITLFYDAYGRVVEKEWEWVGRKQMLLDQWLNDLRGIQRVRE